MKKAAVRTCLVEHRRNNLSQVNAANEGARGEGVGVFFLLVMCHDCFERARMMTQPAAPIWLLASNGARTSVRVTQKHESAHGGRCTMTRFAADAG